MLRQRDSATGTSDISLPHSAPIASLRLNEESHFRRRTIRSYRPVAGEVSLLFSRGLHCRILNGIQMEASR
jgi:hypothetical protein